MQGFLFSKPVPAADFLKIVATQQEGSSNLANA
jgi:sensor c-di-GMP phosphodiesterase-like protein